MHKRNQIRSFPSNLIKKNKPNIWHPTGSVTVCTVNFKSFTFGSIRSNWEQKEGSGLLGDVAQHNL